MPDPQPIRFSAEEDELLQKLKTRVEQRKKKKVSVSSLVRRAFRFAGPLMLSGQVPVEEEVSLKPGSR